MVQMYMVSSNINNSKTTNGDAKCTRNADYLESEIFTKILISCRTKEEKINTKEKN